MADLAVWQRTIVDPAGNTVPNAEVEVRHSDSSALADIYLDREGAQAAPNPITADGNGFVRFYAPGGAYRVEAYGGGATAVWDFVAVGRLAEHDAIGAGQFDDDEGEHEAIRDKLDLASGAEVKVAAEAADTAVDLASEPAREQAAFWTSDEDDLYVAVNSEGAPLFGVDSQGRFFPQTEADGQFYRDDKEVGLVIAGEDGSPLLEFSLDGWLVGGAEARPAFWTSDGQADFSVSSSDGWALLEFDEQGNLLGVAAGEDLEDRVEALEGDFSGLEASVDSLINQGIPGLQNVPESSQGLSDGAPYADRRTLKFAPPYSNLYTGLNSSLMPDHLAIYAHYDNLMSSFPDYISREKIGEDVEQNDIYQYTFSPAELISSDLPSEAITKPKIVYVTGVHGHERGSVVAGFTFFKEMCEDWKNREMLYEMRWGCEFVVVPVLNPSGTDLSTRKNAAGVDLNRNCAVDWETGGSPDPANIRYRGPSPLSEPETQVGVDLTTNHPDACAFIDHHMSSSFPSAQNFAMWVSAGTPAARAVAIPYLTDMTAYLRHEFDFIVQDNSPTSQMRDSLHGSFHRQWEQAGIPAYLLETPTGLGDTTLNMRRHNVEAVRRFMWAVYQTEVTRRQMAALLEE